MILIVTESTDFSTFKVGEWLYHLGKPFDIINENSNVIIDNVCLNHFEIGFDIIIDNIRYKSSDINTVWFRRGGIRLLFNKIDDSLNLEFQEGLLKYMNDEIKMIQEFIIQEFYSKSHFGMIGNINKLRVLKGALSVGLNIPNTLITTTKRQLSDFLDKHQKVISKAIYENVNIQSDGIQYFYPNTLLLKEQLDLLPNNFQATLFQEYIDKYIEIRIFIFIKNLFFSCRWVCCWDRCCS
jgi:hypothetical protein